MHSFFKFRFVSKKLVKKPIYHTTDLGFLKENKAAFSNTGNREDIWENHQARTSSNLRETDALFSRKRLLESYDFS